MRIAITGASGLLGSNVAVEALAAGHEVVATRRAGSKVAHLVEFPIDWVEADLGDEDSLRRAFEGVVAVVHCAAAVSVLRRPTPELVEANVRGTARVLRAGRAAGVKRVVHTSSAVAIGLADGPEPCDETTRWNLLERGLADGYSITKRQAEAEVLSAVADGQDVVIVNPTYMFGPYDARPSSGRMVIEVASGRVPFHTPGLNDFVDVRDVARGTLLALDRGRAGERYILSGHSMSYAQIFALMASLAGVPGPRMAIPWPAARCVGWLGDAYEALTGREPFANSAIVAYGFCADYRCTHAKASAELGYQPGAIEPAIRDALVWFRAHGMLG